MDSSIIQIFTAIAGAFGGGLVTKLFSSNGVSKEEIDTMRTKYDALHTRYMSVKTHLEDASVITSHIQPVFLCGPRAIGKSSLMMQWYTPWDHSKLPATQTHMVVKIPVYQYKGEKKPHFADDSILSNQKHQIMLEVHDFPGDLAIQASIQKEIINSSDKNGLVLICMFNAMDAANQKISSDVIQYYNGDLFKNLRNLYINNDIEIRKVILVFNKFDLLKNLLPSVDQEELLNLCLQTHKEIISLFAGLIDKSKICEVATILQREYIKENIGGSVVQGECIRELYKKLKGEDEDLKIVIPTYASTKSSGYLSSNYSTSRI